MFDKIQASQMDWMFGKGKTLGQWALGRCKVQIGPRGGGGGCLARKKILEKWTLGLWGVNFNQVRSHKEWTQNKWEVLIE